MTSYKITQCSSEDPVHPASNLKNSDLYRAWQTAAGGVKKATVDISFTKPTKITLVDIGNAGSAFVEILVGKGETDDQHLQVLVPINSLMDVHDSKKGQNRTKTKCFEKFTEGVGGKEWDRLRVVCTQPFTNEHPLGLSYLFVNQRNTQSSAPSSTTTTTTTTTNSNGPNKIGKANNNENSDQDTDVDEEMHKPPDRTPESIKRENSDLIKKLKKEMKQKKAEEQLAKHSDEEEEAAPKITNTKQKDNSKQKDNNTKPKDTTKQTTKDSAKKTHDGPKNTILKGVTFVISGIQNPERAEIRDKAVELGAVYKPDWDKDCTHLICKFANTPKYIEVKGKGGIIATPQWILDCNTKNKKLNLTKKYSLEADQPKLSSDSTAEKKKKKKKKGAKSSDPNKGYDSDSNDDSDGGPNEYDYNDSFIDKHFVDPNAEDGDYEPSGSDVETSDEDMNELMRESKAFLKKNGGLKKRPRDQDLHDYEEDPIPEPVKQSKTKNTNKSDPKGGKTFTKQQHKQETNDSKPEKPKHSNNHHNMSDEEDDEERLEKHRPSKAESKPIKHEQSKPPKSESKHKPAAAIKSGEESDGTEEMADADVKAQYKHLMATIDNENAAEPQQKKRKIPHDGSDTEEMQNEKEKDNFPRNNPKTGNYQSEGSDSDGTQPLEKEELMNVIGALQGEAGDGTVAMDAGTNWEDFVSKKMVEKSKETAALGKTQPIEKLPDFLAPVQAFFSGVRKNEHMLRRYIIAYNGKVDDYLGDDTKYIFTERAWDRNFDDALKMNPDLVFVKPEWIFACHTKQEMVDVSRYVITNKK